MKEIKNALLNEKYFEVKHASGLTVLVLPKKDYQTNYAMIGTAFGSADNQFIYDGKRVILPDGTAHFLEHKLFESEETDAFELFAKTGARANAYTSFDRTCYLFSCSENFYENLRSLLSFVTQPYFTEQTVQKEQGIIGQEIKMYRDNPEWQVTLGLLKALYHNCAVNTDIAGSVESIAAITPEQLYTAYNAFYRPDNMVLCICGDVDVQEVLRVCDACVQTKPLPPVAILPADEPEAAVTEKTVKEMPVAIPLFAFGYKETHTGLKTLRERRETVLLNQILAGTMSPLYQQLLSEGLIGEDFSSEYFTGRQNSCVLFTGAGEHGEEIKRRFEQEVQRVRKEGIDTELFECVMKDMYGTLIKNYNAVEDMATDLYECYAGGFGFFEEFESFKEISPPELEKRLQTKYDVTKSAISLIVPTKGEADI